MKKNSLIGGDDFKSGQTKMKSVLVDFLVGAGIKPTSIVSYNHLGNNDGKNLRAPDRKRVKEAKKVEKVIVLWTANTERYSNVVVGLNDTMENLLAAVDRDEAEISPSTLYALACVMENIPFIH
ncbi:hypothetical protein EI016_24445, partial [Escherichia coli]|nr:hypothetical protein [Escherichia coli]